MHKFNIGFEVELLSPYNKRWTHKKLSVYVKKMLGEGYEFTIVDDESLNMRGFRRHLECMEIVTPPYESSKAIKFLECIFSWMRMENCATNTSTGLHINMSFKKKELNSKIDPVQLLANLQDLDIAKFYNRDYNQYCLPWTHYVRYLMRHCVGSYHAHKDINNSMSRLSYLKMNLYRLIEIALSPDQHEKVDRFYRPAKNMYVTKLEPKYTSVNFVKLLNGYLEFRVVGGKDYHLYDVSGIIDHFKLAMTRSLLPLPALVDTWLSRLFPKELVT